MDERRKQMEAVQRELQTEARSSTLWGWALIGAAFIILFLALIFAGGEIRTTGTDASPPETTGVAPKPVPPAAPTTPPSQRP